MSLVDAPIAFYPARAGLTFSADRTDFTFDASTDRFVMVFQVMKTGTIDKIHYRVSAVTSPVMTHRIEMRTVDATTGLPSAAGTLYGSSTSITVDASTYAAGTNYTAAVNATATKGDLVAVVFDLSAYTSGSFTQVRNWNQWADNSGGRTTSFPYSYSNTAAADVLENRAWGGFVLEYSGGVYYPVTPSYVNFVGTRTSVSVTNSGTTRRGNKFTPVVPRRAIGVAGNFDIDGGITLTLRLASDGSLLATATPDKDVRGATAFGLHYYLFDSGATYNLAAGTAYYVGVEGQDGTGATVYHGTAVSNAMLGCMPGGINCHGFTYAGSYSDANTTIYDLVVVTDQEDDGTGGGGSGGSLARANAGVGAI